MSVHDDSSHDQPTHEQLISDLLSMAESIYDGWYSDQRIDWEDFLYRLERHADTDLGNDMESHLIRKIKRHISAYKKL